VEHVYSIVIWQSLWRVIEWKSNILHPSHNVSRLSNISWKSRSYIIFGTFQKYPVGWTQTDPPRTCPFHHSTSRFPHSLARRRRPCSLPIASRHHCALPICLPLAGTSMLSLSLPHSHPGLMSTSWSKLGFLSTTTDLWEGRQICERWWLILLSKADLCTPS
jgi:hypothetical protein